MIATELDTLETLADLMDRLGNVPLRRIRLHPFLGPGIYPGSGLSDQAQLCLPGTSP